MFTLDQLEAAADLVHQQVQPTLQYNWPLLAERVGADVWVKHENHTPTGAFKVRGGIVYLDDYVRVNDGSAGLITATTGNHGQSIPWAARLHGVPVTIYVPYGNSPEKNAAMRALGVNLVEHGSDFDEAWPESQRVSEEQGLHFVKSFHELLARGVATYALEFLSSHRDLDTIYVPVGMGSGICGVITVRDLLGLKTKVVGVVAEQAPAIAQSFEAGRPVSSNSSATFAAGVACRTPVEAAVEVICRGTDRIVQVSEVEIASAIRIYFHDTHNAIEGAGAAPLAALLKEKDSMSGRKVGLVATGGNIDGSAFRTALDGGIPERG